MSFWEKFFPCCFNNSHQNLEKNTNTHSTSNSNGNFQLDLESVNGQLADLESRLQQLQEEKTSMTNWKDAIDQRLSQIEQRTVDLKSTSDKNVTKLQEIDQRIEENIIVEISSDDIPKEI